MLKTELNVRGISRHYNAAFNFIDENINKGLGDKVAIYYKDEEITYKQLQNKVNQFGNALKNLNIENENRILLLCYDSPEFIVSFFGSVKVGAVPIPVNSMMQPTDYEYFLNNSRAKVLVVHEELWENIKHLRDRFYFLKDVIVISESAITGVDVIDYHELVNKASTTLSPFLTTQDDPAFWLYSSGSTGNPKGVIHLQKNMESAFQNYAKNIIEMTEDDITFSASKLFFAYGLGNGMYFPLGAGGSTVLMPERPLPENVLDAIEKYKPTIFFGVPTLYGAMINHIKTSDKSYDLSSIRVCVSAGEALPDTFVKQWKELFGLDILDGIGSTEALHIYLSNKEGAIKEGSSGRAVPGYDVKIVNEQSVPVSDNEIGDLIIKGDSIASGYWNNSSESKKKFNGEWLYTGDKYYKDEDGYYWYCGRSDDMLKVGGIWVSPVEIENCLIKNDKVLEVAVIGVKNDNNLEQPKALIVLKEGIAPTDELKAELKAYVKEHLAPYKYPRIIEFISDLPKTPTGKIQRFKLRNS
ncbi:benzoate-CoA ligase family protein [Desertibacillus haloalkaliphilus]|uniref:benzoate-CoA ligase family protein n=1 Tax=Desertibacillus haloalkaliphilus TaxID=1328930 RepID=UPI001C261A17|nr:benzoate-CoA ligase family protein [Desertibacillus haloalkaliphilus]MBU8908209.1 benzoate-CoA ligase family protein [Desertibacillus haloalkaliphilus]